MRASNQVVKMSKMANNAIISRAKAIYGTFLKPDDYDKLSKMTSVSEVATHLKKHPYFETLLKDVIPSTIHRGQLELLIRKNAFETILKLIKSVYSNDKSYYELSIVKQENDLILSVLRTIISDDLSTLRGKVPYFFDVYTDINLKNLLTAKTFDELLEAVENTDYERILSPFYVRDKNMIRYLDIEFALEKYYYDVAFKRIQENYNGKLKTSLNDIFYTRIELQNIIKIYRLKKFYQSDPITIRQLLNTKHTRMSKQKLDELIEIRDPNMLLKYLASSELKYFKNEKDFVYIEYFAGKIKYDLAKKYMYFTNDVPLFFTAFVTLTELQVDNITNIIEGIRYHVHESELKQMLIY